MPDYSWFKQPVPEGLKVKQVYGICFSDDGRVILRIEDGQYKLTGGKPENTETFEQTLKREYIEELNIELKEINYLGYFLVQENDERYAQVRMIAKIKTINEQKTDPATGKIYGRELVEIEKIKTCLNYQDEAGNKMIDDAISMAKETFINSFSKSKLDCFCI